MIRPLGQFKSFEKSIKVMKLYWKDQGLNLFPNWYILSCLVKVGGLFELTIHTTRMPPLS